MNPEPYPTPYKPCKPGTSFTSPSSRPCSLKTRNLKLKPLNPKPRGLKIPGSWLGNIKNLNVYSLLGLSTLKNVKCYPTTKIRGKRPARQSYCLGAWIFYVCSHSKHPTQKHRNPEPETFQSLGLMVWGLGFRVYGLGFQGQGKRAPPPPPPRPNSTEP